MSVFVTGTDTGVGKTSFTAWLLERLRERGVRCAGYKPICCGDRDDATQLLAASSPGLTIDEVNPVWLQTPASPLTAATVERREIDLAALREGFVQLSERFDFVAVEGVGGWIVPITADYFSSDLAADLRLPVLVIARNRLGCLNHILLTVRSIESAGLNCAGVLLNTIPGESDDVAAATNAATLLQCLPLANLATFNRDRTEVDQPLRQMLPQLVGLV
ncbi:MAG: dethiobiotin synthase [Spartobacteria bacterium]